MALNNDFVKAVADGRLWEVYQRLADILPIDPSLKEQDEMLKYAERHLPDLYQPHDGEVLSTDDVEWTDNYYLEQKSRIEKNFSRERLELLRHMTKHRYADTIKYRAEQEEERRKEAERRHSGPTIAPRHIGGAAAVVGIATVGIGIGIGSTAVTVVGAVVAVGGIVVAVADSTKK
jgi:hypothetical protein